MLLAVAPHMTEVLPNLGGVFDDIKNFMLLDVFEEGSSILVSLDDVIKTLLGAGAFDLVINHLLDLIDGEVLAGSVDDPIEGLDEAGDVTDSIGHILLLEVAGDPNGCVDGPFEALNAG